MDSAAAGFGDAIGATGADNDANAALARMYRFLGGRFAPEGRYPVLLPDEPAPSGRVERWRWFCEGTQAAASTADQLWRRVMDPVQ